MAHDDDLAGRVEPHLPPYVRQDLERAYALLMECEDALIKLFDVPNASCGCTASANCVVHTEVEYLLHRIYTRRMGAGSGVCVITREITVNGHGCSTIVNVPFQLNEVREIQVGEHRLRAASGPLDFPSRLRVGFEKCGDFCQIFIDFLYEVASSEPTDTRRVDGTVIHVGQKSGRMMRLEIPEPKDAHGQEGQLQMGLDLATSHLREMNKHETAELKEKVGPLRRAVHYDMMASSILPGMEPEIARLVEVLRVQRSEANSQEVP